jgi:hypothetical protein
MKNLWIVYGLLLITCFGCNKEKTNEKEKVIEFVKQWNTAHSQLELPYLVRYYSDKVDYYGNKFNRNEVQRHKNLLFEKFPDYTQRIPDGEVNIKRVDGKYLVEFMKEITYADTTETYKSFLSVVKRNKDFRIFLEGVDEKYDRTSPVFPSNREKVMLISNTRQLFGDFNGDGVSDYANVISPEIISDPDNEAQTQNSVRCKTACNSIIVFSDQNLKEITVEGSYQSKLENLKDINNDGADEIGFLDIKPRSKTLYVFSALSGELLCEPAIINTSVHQDLDFIDIFKKTGPNKINLSFSEKVDGQWVLTTKVYEIEPVFLNTK